MQRTFGHLDGAFDLLVVGGGIYGAWTAYDAALRGLRVALVERGDWACGTSSASSKLIHGGLRYLEHGHLALVRRTLAERTRLLRLAPHRVTRLRFALPLHADTRRPAWQLRVGLAAYDLLAGARGDDRHRRLDAAALSATAPWLAQPDLRGGFSYLDAQEDDARMVLELVDGAMQAGAVAVNHAAVAAWLRDGSRRVVGARLVDQCGSAACEVRAAVTVNATGAWANALLPEAARVPVRHTKGVHLLLPLPTGGMACAALLTHPCDGRVFFAIPWQGRALIGTTDTDHPASPDHCAVDETDIAYLLEGLAARCPAAGWSRERVLGTFAGLRTMVGSAGSPAAASREWILTEPLPGLLQPVGGKYTSARVEAGEIVDRACRMLGRPVGACPTAERPLPWAPSEPWDAWLAAQITAGTALGLDPPTAESLARRHGTRVALLHRRLAAEPTDAARLDPALPFVRAELAHAREAEMACTADDVWRRRLPQCAHLAAPAAPWQ
jgi:glycerol-3-phosphate dehydrogenase